MAESQVHRLRVADVIQETADACSLVFDAPEQAGEFAYRPGQFLTLRIPSRQCGSVARCYSLSSSPHADRGLKVTVKRAEEGYASNWICDNVKPGTELDALTPAGAFTPRSLDDDLLLFAAGSGITPIISIIKSVLTAGRGRLTLMYASRDADSVIFASELARLSREQPDRLVVVHWLESLQGLPTAAALRVLAGPYLDRAVFLCGPRGFMDTAIAAVRGAGVGRTRIHLELFTSLAENPFETHAVAEPVSAEVSDTAGAVEVELDGEQHTFAWPARKKLLDLLLENRLDAPYSCREGACGACTCRIVAGEVTMVRNEVLEEVDLADGYVLACQALPLTEKVKITYSD